MAGGPLFRALRRLRLSDGALGQVRRRIVAFILLTWAPLLVLSQIGGGFGGPQRGMTFLADVECHVRFLFVVPLLIFAERIAHLRLATRVDQFRARHLLRPDEAPHFAEALRGAARLRDSAVAEAILLAAVYVLGIFVVWRQYVALPLDTWYAASAAGVRHLSPAGLWFVLVSLPVFQFLLIRWYFRLFVWARFLWRVSQLDLNLHAIHPDKAGGLGFLGESLYAFIPIGVAHGALFAGMIANRVFFGEARLVDFEVELFAGVVLLLAMVAGPLTVFAPQLVRVRREGLGAYSALAQTYVRTFSEKWLEGAAPPSEPLVGSSDIQSLADLANGFAVADQIGLAPISRKAVVIFVGATLAPLLPLVFTMTSVEKLVARLVGLVL